MHPTPDLSRRRTLQGMATLAAGGLVPGLHAQAARWPDKPLRVVVPFPPGGLTDAYARLFADHFSQTLGQPSVVDNRPGGGAIIGISQVAKAPADGYTLLVSTSGTVWQNRVLYSKLPYNLDTDLTPVAVFPSGPLAVAVAPDVPARTMREFIAWAQAPRQTNMASYAPGSYPHMVADQLNRHAGTKIQPVQYKGESPMWIDVAGNSAQIGIGSYQAFATVQGRGVRAIGVTGNYRSPKLPDVPTLAEQGIDTPLVKLEGGLALMAPAGTPEAVLLALNKVALACVETERGSKLRENFGIPNKPKNLAATRKDWDTEVPVWIKLAVELGIKLD
ncbi:Bug family tripartite tricarboxylate transporter substrate binding protein [Pseudorhodoferax soli]|uniref:Tripartite-type tricarboxylate transporter receptor subunit TctC n=1 Tax=Pseudorhodoferax soli TaxID=545864 RepID=A0A368XXT6_9BURK|nr:tripartite tricarboxylate transporter substrate binding protein [Pseudorhodoferax soli]RCW72782.1 tripartite-type tricarboxylate transporter receptor subunit TctC [Pseudorhodoferax soli]